MRRLRLWIRWSWRDLRRRWVLVIAIALVIAIGTGIYAGLGSMENWRKASNDASFDLLDAHDLEVSLTAGTHAPAGRLGALLGSIPAADQVAESGERLVAPTQVAVERLGREPLLVPGELVGSELAAGGPSIDGIAADRGRALRGEDGGEPVGVLEASFGEYHELPAAGTLRLAGGERLRYVGQGRSPEYFLVTRPGGGDFGGAEANFAVVFTSLRTAQRAIGRPVANDLVLSLRPDAEVGEVRRQLESALERSGLTGSVTTQEDETAHRVLYQDAEGDQQLFNVFAVLILAGAAFATFNLASRIVEAQRREIGIGMAIGVPPWELAIRPLLLGAQIAVAGAALGVALGLFAGDIFRGVLEDLLPLPVTRTPFELGVFIRGALLGLALPLLATAIPVWRGVRMTPVEAIRVGFQAARSSGIAGLAKRLHLPGSSLVQLPLRNALRAPRRTLMTALGIGAVVTVVVAFLGFVDSFLATVDRSEAEVTRLTPDRTTVSLDGFRAERSPTVAAVTGAGGIEAAEARLDFPGRLSSSAGSFEAAVTLLSFRSLIWAPTIVEGRAPEPGELGIVLAEEAARDLDVEVGEEVVISHPARRGGGAFAERRTAVRVTGLHPDPFRTFAYMDRSEAPVLGLDRLVSDVSVVPAQGVSEDGLARELFDVPGVASVERASATTEFVRERLDDFIGVLRLTVAFALALALLIAFNSSSISADERARENATMLAFGVPVRGAVALAVGESLIVGLLGTLLGLGGGLLVIGWVVSETLPETLPDLGLIVSIGAGSLLTAALVGVVAVALAPLLTARRVRRMDVPSTLRVVE